MRCGGRCSTTEGDIICFLDADTADPHCDHLLGVLAPILSDESVALVKGAFERPLTTGTIKLPHEGGRVTELMARPLLNLHTPLLAGFSQPLAGEVAARLICSSTPFPVGYGVEIAMLVDALHLRGLDALAECHLGTRQNRHQPLRALGEMSFAVLIAVENRLPGRDAAGSASSGRYVRTWENGPRYRSRCSSERPYEQTSARARRPDLVQEGRMLTTGEGFRSFEHLRIARGQFATRRYTLLHT